jgi:mRNA interferase RelE/StbE
VWRIEYNEVAERSILDLDKPVRQRVLAFMRDRVASSSDPKGLAEHLHGELRGLWRFRVGDYRVICDIHKAIEVVEVLEVGHRSRVYKKPRLRKDATASKEGGKK